MASPSDSSQQQLSAFHGLSDNSGFVLVRRRIGDWRTAVGPGEAQVQVNVAHGADSEGRPVSVAMMQPKRSVAVVLASSKKKSPDHAAVALSSKGPNPAELPFFMVNVDESRSLSARALLRRPARSLVMATVGDHALLLINKDLFVYDSEKLALPHLLLLPRHPRAGDWHFHRRTTGVARLGDTDTFTVVSLRSPQLDSTGWGDLLQFDSSRSTWEVKPLVLVPGANMSLRVQQIDSTVALGNGTVCWTDFSKGMVIINVFEDNPQSQYFAFPESLTSHYEQRYLRNTVCSVDGRVTIIATKKKPRLAYEFVLFELDMATAVWVQKTTVDIPWASAFCPWFPTLNSQDPRLLYFLEQGPSRKRWYLHGINTKAKPPLRTREQVLFTCDAEEIAETAPWVTMQLTAANEGTTANEGGPIPKKQRDTVVNC